MGRPLGAGKTGTTPEAEEGREEAEEGGEDGRGRSPARQSQGPGRG